MKGLKLSFQHVGLYTLELRAQPRMGGQRIRQITRRSEPDECGEKAPIRNFLLPFPMRQPFGVDIVPEDSQTFSCVHQSVDVQGTIFPAELAAVVGTEL